MDSKKHFILFDFDGVIVNSFRPAFEVNKMICPHITEDEYRKRFEGNINDWEESSLHTKDCRHDIDFFTEYIPKMETQVSVVNGMREIIQQLSQSYTLIIVSSTITSPIQEFIKKHNLEIYFTEIMGNDIHASKVKKMKMILSKYGINSDNCVFITDTLGDIKEASRVGINTIGVTWGFQNKETLLKGNPSCIIDKPEALLSAISNYFNK